jgi:alkylation response protein AidB-like acyl-CoA dehydrogenase
MNLDYGPEHQAFRAELRAFLESNRALYPARFGVNRPTEEARAWQKLLLGNGYAARTIPKEYGCYGAEPDLLKARIIAEEFRRAKAPPPLLNQGIAMLVPTLLELGTDEQKQRWIGPTLRGEIIWCQGYSEPDAGSDLASLRTRAVDDGDDFVINGQKIWTTTAHAADMIFCLVRTEPGAPKYLGISYLIFSMRTPGIDVRPLRTMTGESEFNEVFFTDVRVPHTQVVGKRGQGWTVSNATLKHERDMLGNADVSAARLQAVLDLLRETGDGNHPVRDNAEWRARAMALQGRVFAMQFHGMRLLSAAAKGEDLRLPRLIVKLQTTELNHQIDALAVDILGERGLLWQESPDAHSHGVWQTRYMFDLGMIIGGGTAQIQKNIIAERGLGMPREPKLAKVD